MNTRLTQSGKFTIKEVAFAGFLRLSGRSWHLLIRKQTPIFYRLKVQATAWCRNWDERLKPTAPVIVKPGKWLEIEANRLLRVSVRFPEKVFENLFRKHYEASIIKHGAAISNGTTVTTSTGSGSVH